MRIKTDLWVRVEGTEVERRDLQVLDKVNADTRCIGVGWWVCLLEPALISYRDEMVRVDRLDVCANGLSPRIDRRAGGVTSRGRRSRRSRAARLVGELPSHNGRLVNVTAHKVLDVVLVRSNDLRVRVERVVRSAGVQLRDVDVHSPVVRPVVGEGNDKADAVRLRVRDDGVEARDTEAASVEGRNAVLPELVVCTVFLRRSHVVKAPGKYQRVNSAAVSKNSKIKILTRCAWL